MTDFLRRVRSGDPRLRVALALDLPDAAAALDMVDQMGDQLRIAKVGLQLFVAEGPPFVRELRQREIEVFLDLKLHDIPNTMAHTVESMAGLDVAITTVHAAAGRRAIEATAERCRRVGGPLILAVTVLTSFDDAEYSRVVGHTCDTAREVPRLGGQAWDAGADGLVTSPREVEGLRKELGSDPLLVVPGVRPTGSEAADQRRVATPAAALAAGADLLVIGRPLTQAPDPADALARILDEMRGAS